MAELQGGLGYIANRGAPDILSGLQVGAGIAQRQQQLNLAQQQYMSGLKQLEIENQRKEDQLKMINAEHQYNMGVNIMKAGQKLGDVEKVKEGFRTSLTAAGAPIPEGFLDELDQKTYERFLKIEDEKDPKIQAEMGKMFLKDIGTSMQAFERRAETIGLPIRTKEQERQRKLKETIEDEKRKLTYELGKERFKTEEDIRKEKAKITAATEAMTDKEKADEEAIRNALKAAKVDEATINKIIAASKTGVGLPAEKALFPDTAGDVSKKNIFFRPVYDEYGERVGETPIQVIKDPKTGQLVYREIKKMEEPTGTETKSTEQKATVATPEQSALNYIKKTKKLGTLKHVKGAPTVKEYLESVANNPQNVDEYGDIIVPEEDLFEDYKSLLESQKTTKKDERKKARESLKSFLRPTRNP